MPAVLNNRELGRATLARQHLLEPSTLSVTAMVQHLYGLQAQSPTAPYFALRTRLRKFAPDELSELLISRAAVRIVCMRGTVHLLLGADALVLRTLTQPIMTGDLSTNPQHSADLAGVDFAELAAVGSGLVRERPRSIAELRDELAQRYPDRSAAALVHGLRDLLPMVQVPPRGVWGKAGQPTLTTLDNWVGQPIPVEPAPEQMVLRYLAAYGPASVQDVQAWCGLTRLGEVVDRLRPQLEVFTSESGTELFDLTDAPRPDADSPAPLRILAPFDNVLLSHADRTRIMDPEHKAQLFTVNGIIKPAVLIDGRTVGFCAIEKSKSGVVLDVTPFGKLSKRTVAAIEREGLQLLRFAHPKAATFDVRVGVG